MNNQIEMVCFKCKTKYTRHDNIAVDVHNKPICIHCQSPLFDVIRNNNV